MQTIYRVLGKRGRVTIPFDIRRRVGFGYNDVLSFTESDDGRTVMVRREKICGDCKNCGCSDNSDEVTLKDFLDSLSLEEQRAALIHLSVAWAEKQGGLK